MGEEERAEIAKLSKISFVVPISIGLDISKGIQSQQKLGRVGSRLGRDKKISSIPTFCQNQYRPGLGPLGSGYPMGLTKIHFEFTDR